MWFSVIVTVLSAIACAVQAAPALGGKWLDVNEFDADPIANPTGLRMHLFIPDKLPPNPTIVVALHYCGSSGPGYALETRYTLHAAQRGFITIFPSAPHDFNCWNVGSPETLRHDGGGDSNGVANMIRYTLSKYAADPARVYVTGASSGAMMTNVMCTVYAELFEACSAYMGVASGCFAGSPGFSPFTADRTCPEGRVRKSGEEWAELARSYNPGFEGVYPRFMTWHGTVDPVLRYVNLGEEIKQWSTLLDVGFVGNSSNDPVLGVTKMRFGDGGSFVAYSVEGIGHALAPREEIDLEWFGIL